MNRRGIPEREDLRCRCCGALVLHEPLYGALRELARRWGGVRVTSGYRCPSHNRRVGGVPGSLHTRGRAVDLACPASRQGELLALAKELGFDQRIPYPSRGFVHLGWRRD